ncbi:glycoside hydrolase family 15 protein [Gordonia sp. HNM0687]|uniref:Glycoside hydrolase family 15 protein n=1 Tax=Gordonia mangrovi TaxID=2665643 RepID=A0A6L7GU98_9ACTN|nr:glycoside hydrolase family 15 protein [Gordonia mangrovi]MXP23584.1 glycoside hydrolase family 15 protein [Gordonia mangrovi]UVF79651.1 glycoside hydrolase family 15 protein [Gordonia mangrovi]
MGARIEDYAMVGDCRTAALISADGSIDWLCVPRFDSASIFAALLGSEEHGHWRLAPRDPAARATRGYDADTLILTTRWETSTGTAEVHEFMPIDGGRVDLVRRVVGVSGYVDFETELRMRFDYAKSIPWVLQVGDTTGPALRGIAGPDACVVRGLPLHADGDVHRGYFTVEPDVTMDLTLTWYHSHREEPGPLAVDDALTRTRAWWTEFASRIDHTGPHHEQVIRSLITLRALSNMDTGGIVAAATTSLPEQFGGARNWDYRYVWLRDASLTLEALVNHGFLHVAEHWRMWLMRAIAGDTEDIQIMYGIAGERDLIERELPQLPGYANSAPVRIGNGAVDQYQGDVIGEVMVGLDDARDAGLAETRLSWALQKALLEQVEAKLEWLDNGIWEMRGEPRMFTQSRVMKWAAFDRGVRAVERYGLDGSPEHWRDLRDRLRYEIDTECVDPGTGRFVQYAGTDEVDASLLLLPQVGFCAPNDPRMLATVEHIERTLLRGGLVLRYRTGTGVDGLQGDEHPFLACTFWLVTQYARSGRADDAAALMKTAVATANDVGLFSEEYNVDEQRQAGNTPQALSHLAFVRAANALASV